MSITTAAMAVAVPIWKPVKPEGLAKTILVVTIIMTITCIIVFGLRVWVRIRTALFDKEDYLMCVGMTLNMVHNAIVIFGCYTGIGTPDAEMGIGTMMEGGKVILLWQVFYSICATLMRISLQRRYQYILWGLVAITIVVNTVALCAALARCRPIEAAWNPSLGTCLDQSIIIVLTYVVSAVNIFVHWSVAIIPVFILWKVQMRRRLKVLTGGILGIGVLASIVTVIRIMYSDAYSETVNTLHDIGNIILWTIVECGLGIIAGSLPMLRYLQFTPSNNVGLITFGRSNKIGHNRTIPGRNNVVTTVISHGGSNENIDSESTRNIITVTRQYNLSRSEDEGEDFKLGRLDI